MHFDPCLPNLGSNCDTARRGGDPRHPGRSREQAQRRGAEDWTAPAPAVAPTFAKGIGKFLAIGHRSGRLTLVKEGMQTYPRAARHGLKVGT